MSSEPQFNAQVLGILADVQMLVREIRGRLAGATKELYTVEEIARLTGRAAYTVRVWVKAGKIRAERISGTGPRGKLLIPREELNKLIQLGKGADVAMRLGDQTSPAVGEPSSA